MKFPAAFKYPKTVILITALITALLGSFIPRLAINNDVVIFLPKNNPHRIAFENLNHQFGKNDGIIIAATLKEGFIYDSAAIAGLLQINEQLARIDSVDEIFSLTSSDYIQGVAGGLETFPIVQGVPQNRLQEEEIKRRLMSWNIYKNTLYSADFKTAMTLVTPGENSIARDKMIYHQVISILQPYRSQFDFQVAGFPSIFVLVGQNMTHDLAWLIPFVLIVVVLSLWYSFKTPAGVVLPLLTVALSTIWTLGLMSLLGFEMTLIATVVPVLLVAVGSAYGIHIMAHYYDELAHAASLHNSPLNGAQHEQLLIKAMESVGGPVLMAALTTIVGFGSLATSHIIPVRDFGIFTALGVAAAYGIGVTLIPSILHFSHGRTPKAALSSENRLTTLLLAILERFVNRPRAIVLVVALCSVVALFGMSTIRVGSAIINFFKSDSTLWQANNWLQNNTNGTVTLSIIIRDAEQGTLTHPRLLKRMDQLSLFLSQRFTQVKKVGSIVDLVKRMNEVMHSEEPLDSSSGGFYEIPWDPHRYGLTTQDELQQLIVQYLMLFSGDITSFADDAISPTRLRMVVQMNSNDVDTLAMIQSTAQRWLADSLPPSYTIEIAGTADAELEVNKLIVHSQIASIISSMLIVLLILALYYRSVVAGVLGMLCLALPLLFNFGAMGLLGIHLDIATAMISSIAIGIGIDYIIHFMDGYARELQKAGGRWEGISQRTLKSRGPAILFNALSVALGFAVILFSNFKPLNHLGGLIFFTMLNSSLVSLTLLPVILDKMRPSFLLKYHLHTPQKGAL